MSSYEAIQQRRRQRAAQKQTGEGSSRQEQPFIPVNTDHLEEPHSTTPRTEHILTDSEGSSEHIQGRYQNKRPNTDDLFRTYVPRWNLLETDAISIKTPKVAKEVGPELCHGMMLPGDQPFYNAASGLEATTEALAYLAMVRPLIT